MIVSSSQVDLDPWGLQGLAHRETLLGVRQPVSAAQSYETQSLLQDNKTPKSTKVLLWVVLQVAAGLEITKKYWVA